MHNRSIYARNNQTCGITFSSLLGAVMFVWMHVDAMHRKFGYVAVSQGEREEPEDEATMDALFVCFIWKRTQDSKRGTCCQSFDGRWIKPRIDEH